MFNTKEQGLMWCKFWTGLNSKFLCSFVDMPDKINLLENSIEHWNELRTEKFLVKEFASEHRIIYSRCLREIIFYYDCKIFLKLDTIKNSSRREAQDAIEEINNFHLHSIEISLELLKFAEKNPDYSSDHLTMLLNLASAYRSLIYDGKKKRAKMIHKSTMYINKAVKMLKETHLPGLSICIHATDCQPCRALLDVQTKEESVNLLIAQIENTWYLKKFRDAAVTETSEVDIDNVFEMLNQFEKYVERIVTRITCGCQESVAWETIETYVNEALTLYEEFKQRHHNVDELGQAKLTAMETHFKFFEMSIQVRRNKCLVRNCKTIQIVINNVSIRR